MSVHDTQNPESREAALEAATDAVRAGKLIVLPTDTVYGIGADAFTPDAVTDLRDAKGRGRDMPPPVLVGDHAVLLALALDVPSYVEELTEAFWPGPLTLILTAQPSLTWDLGETRGTVALRMPDDELALELLRRTGPLAVSSANRTGKPAALSVLDAATQLGDSVEEYLDGGPAKIGTSSTIIDTTVEPPEIVRQGALTQEEIVAAVGDIFTPPATEDPEGSSDAEDAAPGDDAAADDDPATSDDAAGSDGPATAESASGATTADAATATTTPAQGAATGTADAADEKDPAAAAATRSTGVLDLPAEPDLVELSDAADAESLLVTPGTDAEEEPAPEGEAGEAPRDPSDDSGAADAHAPDAHAAADEASRQAGGSGEEHAAG